jgi:hypothetical protein
MEICMQASLLSLLLNLVLSVGNVMLPIEDLMVDGGCLATSGGRRLFCILLMGESIFWVLAEHAFLALGSFSLRECSSSP